MYLAIGGIGPCNADNFKTGEKIEVVPKILKYECVYPSAFDSGEQAKKDIGEWIKFYDQDRSHSNFGLQAPKEVYMLNSHTIQVSPTATLA